MSKTVLHYTYGKTEINIPFPNGNEVCRWCSLFLRYEDAYKRYSCRLTGEWILDPGHERGQECPFRIEVQEHD